MVAHLAEGHLQLPTLDEPPDDLQRVLRRLGAQQRLWVEALERVAQQHPADRHRRHPGMPPDGGAGVDLHGPVSLAVPAGHGHAPPWRLLVGQHRREGRQARPLGPRPTDRGWLARRGRRVEGGIEAQPGAAGHASAEEGGQELERGEAAVGHEDQRPLWHPAAGLQDQLPGPAGQLLMAPAMLAAVPPRGGECGQERQGPGPPGPGDRDQPHQAEPSQATGLDEVAVWRAHRVAVDALGGAALAAPALDGVGEAEDHRAARGEGVEQQPQQQTGCQPPTPGGAVEHAMVVDEAPLPGEPGDPQQAGHRALPGRQDGADQQHLGMPPTPLEGQRREA